MLSSLDITRILAESQPTLISATIDDIRHYRKERLLQIYVAGEKRLCLNISYHPEASGFYILPASQSNLDVSEKPRPFARDLCGGIITSIRQVLNDRIVEIEIRNDDVSFFLAMELLGPNGNIWLLDAKRRILASLRNRDFSVGQVYQPPTIPKKENPFDISETTLGAIFETGSEINPARLMEKSIYGVDYYLAEMIVGTDAVTDDISVIYQRFSKIISYYQSADQSIYAYQIKGKIHFYPIPLNSHSPLGKYKTLSEAQKETLAVAREETQSRDLQETTMKNIDSRFVNQQRLLKELEKDINEASRYKEYLQYVDLLKINLSHLRRGMSHVTVENLYQEGKSLEIPLDPKLSGQRNIEMYSKKYQKGKEGLALLRRRRENASRDLEMLEKAREAFETDFEKGTAAHPELLVHPAGSKAKKIPTAPLPYKTCTTSTGLTIFVGKSGDNNDRTTFEHGRPYDFWFHASQCPGSHVILRLPDKTYVPSRHEIEEAAAVAAWHSKARGSAKVPVNYTLCKYVHKPRRAKPGLVTIDHEKTIMVVPTNRR